ncbi:N-acetylmuramoyl-L-alanine amidase [Paenibacillus terrigena]|uniref:N-acetylmuramoyl-L-alanine amidase family protein n=1 Tax=Paenibacillus terrigena TaxID=369333 RepID=UPI0028D09082|nr:N-acetylmuramoyl-L-alanine amidase [Paenibacillus terrigena]
MNQMRIFHRLLLTSILIFISCHTWSSSVAAEPASMNEVFTHPVIVIDVGHGGIDGGTSHENILEKNINLEIGTRLYLLLQKQGIHAVLNRTGDYALSEDNHWLNNKSRHRRDLAQRRQLTEEIPTEMLVSLHVNWNKNRSRRGPVVLYKEEGRSIMLANIIQNALNKHYGTHMEMQSGKPFYLLRRVNQPAVIIETGFISNSVDRRMLCDPKEQTAIASTIAGALQYYLSLL